MRVEKRVLNDALRVLGKVVCLTSLVRNFCLIVRIEACGSRILHNVEVKMRSVKFRKLVSKTGHFGAFLRVFELKIRARKNLVTIRLRGG